jgi:hypothetical protein
MRTYARSSALALALLVGSANATAQVSHAPMRRPEPASNSAGIVIHAPRVDPARVPSIAPVTLGIPAVSEYGSPTFDACPNDRDALGVPGVGCGRWQRP